MNSIIKAVRGFTPQTGNNCYLAEGSVIVGDVILGNNCSVWFNAVIRGDVNKIRIGNNVNIQDGAIIHCTFNGADTKIGNNVSIGHNAIVHGCEVHDNVLIGMGAIVMDNCILEEKSLIAAGAIVLENTRIESGFLYAGVPAKKIKLLDAKTLDFHIDRTAKNYIKYAKWFQK
jgi:carbonic anhydrase/acetyltransferase-like protein (isoleucine patch superfamily)